MPRQFSGFPVLPRAINNIMVVILIPLIHAMGYFTTPQDNTYVSSVNGMGRYAFVTLQLNGIYYMLHYI